MNSPEFAKLFALCAAITLAGCRGGAKEPEPEFTPSLEIPHGTLGRANLVEFGMAYRDYTPKDEFSPQTADGNRLLGRKFHVVIPSFKGRYDWEKPYQYDGEKQTLRFFVCPPISLYYSRKELGQQERSNAFGATVSVKVARGDRIVLGRYPTGNVSKYDEPKDMGIIKLKPGPFGDPYYECLEKIVSATPDQARKMTASLSTIVDGTIVDGNYGGPIACVATGSAATLNNPSEENEKTCSIAPNITNVKIRSGKKIIAQWGMN
ncbi:MAG: hypothetical protein ACREBO_12205 [Novosphingobium sp.]